MQPAQDFSVVYGRWMPSLTRYCRTILRDEADAEDAAQNAMLKAMDALAAGPAPDRLPPWLHRIARNEAITLLRRRHGGMAVLDDEVLPSGASAEEVAATRRRLGELLGDLQALPDRQREALILRELDGLSHRRIAAHLGITEAAAQQAVLDARRSLHAYAEGRDLACDRVQAWLSAHEHARLRTRGVRAHLRDCGGCRAFSTALHDRPRDLALVLPAGGLGLVARILALLGGTGGGGAVALKGLAAAGVLALPLGLGGSSAATEGPPAGPPVAPIARAVTTAAPVAATVTPVRPRPAAASRAARIGSRPSGGRRGPRARAHDVTRHRSPAPGRTPDPATSAGAAGTSGDGPAAPPRAPRAPTPAESGTSAAPVVPSRPAVPAPVSAVVDPVLATVDRATTTVTETAAGTADAVTGTVEQVTGAVSEADPTGTVGAVTDALRP